MLEGVIPKSHVFTSGARDLARSECGFGPHEILATPESGSARDDARFGNPANFQIEPLAPARKNGGISLAL